MDDIESRMRAMGDQLRCHAAAHGTIADTEAAGEMLAAGAAEIVRLRAVLEVAAAQVAAERERWLLLLTDSRHLYRGDCPEVGALDARDSMCPACRELGDWRA